MYNKKSYNGLLTVGIISILAGLALLVYCITSYSEIKLVTDKIDFDELDNNIHISTSDKYYKHLSIWDTLNQKLEKNKNLPVKNMSCAYLDYAQHNIKSLYKLIYKSANEDSSRRSIVEGNIKSLSDMYDNYKSCRKTALYKDELAKMLDEIENSDDIFYQGRMETFINGNRDIERVDVGSAIPDGEVQDEVYPQYRHEQTPATKQNEVYIQPVQQQASGREEQFKQVQQYIEPNNNDNKTNNNNNGRIYYGEAQTFGLDGSQNQR